MIAVFGAGFLGTRIARFVPGATLLDADIADAQAVRSALASSRFEGVVNAAGKTGRPNVDWCETHQAETVRSNVTGPLVVAAACAEIGAYLLHLGTGCIFYGSSPAKDGWREDDFANPASFYSRTKYATDLVLSRLPNVGIARARMLIDGAPHPKNLITKLASYSQVVDVENSVTVVDDLLEVVRVLVAERAPGVFHATNPGAVKHREILALYRDLVDPSHAPQLISADDLLARGLARAPRSNCLLASRRLGEIGVHMRPVGVALRDAMTKYARARRIPGA